MNILILGATGCIGKQSINIISESKIHKIVGITFFTNEREADIIAKKYKIKNIFCHDSNDSLEIFIKRTNPDLVINAISGFSGLESSFIILQNGIDLALANKESIVLAGPILKQLSLKNNARIIPIDSEHTSLMQLLINNNYNNIKKIFITASGGPFYYMNYNELKNVGYQQAIKHPTWQMGNKISLDSATLVNKCFEIIEANFYFPNYNIGVVQHKQSIVHAFILNKDNSYNMLASKPDMKHAIGLALNNFESPAFVEELSFNNLTLSFEEINPKIWPPIQWGINIIKEKKLYKSIALNAANDVCHVLFKKELILFTDFFKIIDCCLKLCRNEKINNYKDILKYNEYIKEFVLKNYKKWKS